MSPVPGQREPHDIGLPTRLTSWKWALDHQSQDPPARDHQGRSCEQGASMGQPRAQVLQRRFKHRRPLVQMNQWPIHHPPKRCRRGSELIPRHGLCCGVILILHVCVASEPKACKQGPDPSSADYRGMGRSQSEKTPGCHVSLAWGRRTCPFPAQPAPQQPRESWVAVYSLQDGSFS